MKRGGGARAEEAGAAEPRKTRRDRFPKKWRKRAIIAAGAIALYAIVGFLVVPPIAKSQIVKLAAQRLHRRASIERLRFNPFTFTAVVAGFDLRDRDGTELLKFDRLIVDFQLSSLFRRAWTFKIIKIERPHLVARIGTDGRPSIADLFVAGSGAPPPSPGLPPRIIVARFEMDAGRLDFVDESRTPRFAQTLDPLTLAVDEFSTIPGVNGDHGLTFGIGPDTRIRWTGRQTVEPLHLEGQCEVTGLSLPLLWGYAAPAPALDLRDGRADLSWNYDIRKDAAGLGLSITKAALSARDVALRPASGGEDWLTVPLAEARGLRMAWPAQTLDIGEIKITQPRALAALAADGRLNWQAALAGPPGAPAAAGAAPAGAAAKPWTVKVGSVEIENGAARFDDRAAVPPVAIDLSEAGVRLENISSDLKAPVAVRASVRINKTGQVSASGTVTPEPAGADLEVGVSNLDLVPLRAYVKMFPGAEIRAGRAELKGKVRLAQGSPAFRFEGEGSVAGLDLAGAGSDRMIAWELARATGVVATRQPDRMRIARFDLVRPFIKIDISRDGKLNLAQLAAPAPASNQATAAPGPAQAPAPATAPAMPVDIAAIEIRDATLDYTDESLVLPFDTNIYSTNGTLRDLSMTSAAAARLDLEGRVAQAGFFKAKGTLRIADPFASTDIAVTFRKVPMPALTPYVAQFAGYSVKTGDLDVDVRYRIQDRRLVGQNKVVMTDLVLGPKVEGAKGPGLPVRLAIALLKDKDGRIDLDVPVEGTVDSPEFNYGKLFWQAFKKILTNLVTAPFRALGRLFGGGGEDLDLVGFSSGSSELLPAEKETLSKISAELSNRAEITIEVGGRYDPQTDSDALRRARLEARIDAKRNGTATLESILEGLYVETFSAEKLEAERAKFMPQAAQNAPEKKKTKKKQPPPPPPAGFNAAGFYDSLRAQLLAAEPVGDIELQALARDRAAAIVAALTAPGGLEPARVKAGDPKPVTRKKQGSDLVASEMTMSAGD